VKAEQGHKGLIHLSQGLKVDYRLFQFICKYTIDCILSAPQGLFVLCPGYKITKVKNERRPKA